jgi:hypothetical protein
MYYGNDKMYSCASCGKVYKQQGCLNNHIKRSCPSGAASASGVAAGAIKKGPMEHKKPGAASGAAAGGNSGTNTVITNTNTNTNNISNTGNEEHNATFNIKYVKRSEETQEVVKSIVAAANEFCKGRIIVTSDEPAPGGGPLTGIHMTVNDNGTTVYNHPIRTISIIETPPEDYSPEEEHDITLEKMTYMILTLIQNNNKLKKENYILRSIVARIDPACFDDDDDEDEKEKNKGAVEKQAVEAAAVAAGASDKK